MPQTVMIKGGLCKFLNDSYHTDSSLQFIILCFEVNCSYEFQQLHHDEGNCDDPDQGVKVLVFVRQRTLVTTLNNNKRGSRC